MLREKIGKQVMFFDGAMGTSLQKVGLEIGEVPELFNFKYPERVQEVHRGYLEAGSNFITTNTFGANRYKVKDTPYTVDQVIKQAVDIAKKAKQDYKDAYIALDIGSTGKLLEPMGEVTFKEIYEVFKEQVVAGEKYGCDIVLIETFMDLTEFEAAILAAKENTTLPIFCTMSFDANMRTFFGVTLEDMVTLAQNLGVDVLGINCSLGPKELSPVVQKIMKIASTPVLVQPNAGLPNIENGKAVYNITADEFADYTAHFAELGVSLLGGCCGTTPDYIRKMIEKIKN